MEVASSRRRPTRDPRGVDAQEGCDGSGTQAPPRACRCSALGLVIGLLVGRLWRFGGDPVTGGEAAVRGTPLDGVWLLTDYVSVDGTNYTVPSP